MPNLADLIQLSFINKIATGYPIIDILLCVLIPWLISKLGEWSARSDIGLSKLAQWFCCCSKVIEREIKYVMITNEAGAVFDIHNRYMLRLQDSILRYINKHNYIKDGGLKDGLVSIDTDNDDVILQPASNKWISLKNGISLKIYRYEDKTDNYVFNCNIFTLKSKRDIIDKFIKTCYTEYTENRYVATKSCHYMFVPYFGNDYDIITFNRYKLEDNKTFDLLFHPQVAEVTKLLDDFMNKRGRFAIKGFPYKLGFLLHGKPGTGKTSFIKALRTYTNRHIVNVSLSKIKTNQQLIDLMFSTKLIARHAEAEFHITFDNVIYILEDIDVLSDIVRARDSKAASNTNDTEDNDDGDNDDNNKGSKGSSKKKNDALDKLNLAGLLNVLDGILETPGRIVVMTTNHPEHLDPALIRPGRVNKTIHMGNIDTDSALKMIEYYVGKLDDKQRQFIMNEFPQDKITPAYLESKCMDFTDIKSVINWIKTL